MAFENRCRNTVSRAPTPRCPNRAALHEKQHGTLVIIPRSCRGRLATAPTPSPATRRPIRPRGPIPPDRSDRIADQNILRDVHHQLRLSLIEEIQGRFAAKGLPALPQPRPESRLSQKDGPQDLDDPLDLPKPPLSPRTEGELPKRLGLAAHHADQSRQAHPEDLRRAPGAEPALRVQEVDLAWFEARQMSRSAAPRCPLRSHHA